MAKDSSEAGRELKKRKRKVECIDLWEEDERESEESSAEKDLQTFLAACGEFRKVLDNIVQLKKKQLKTVGDSASVDASLAEQKMEGALTFVILKKLNRLDKLRVRNFRRDAAEARQKVDSQHLHLQNLLYEGIYLQKEVSRCLEFKSKDAEIDLVPIEQFYAEAPTKFSKPESTRGNQHLQTLARLEWELEQRKKLAERCRETRAVEGRVSSEIGTKRACLDNLSPMLQSVLQASRPLQEYFDMPSTEYRRAQTQAANHLPLALFTLYVRLSAYRDASADPSQMRVVVAGEVDEAIALNARLMGAQDKEEESDSDADPEESGSGTGSGAAAAAKGATSKKKKKKHHHHHHRSSHGVPAAAEPKQKLEERKLLQKFPLSVRLSMPGKTTNDSMQLTFSYVHRLNIVTVETKLSGPSFEHHQQTFGLFDSLLSCLFPGDDGLSSPNPANQFQLNRLGMGEFDKYAKQVGRAYGWAQRVAGLDFLSSSSHKPPEASSSSSVAASVTHVENVMTSLRQRLASRTALQEISQQIERGVVKVSDGFRARYPSRVGGVVCGWTLGVWDDVRHTIQVESFVEAELLTGGEPLVFRLTAKRGSAILRATILVRQHYPIAAPLFVLAAQLQPGAAESTSLTDPHLAEIERELNSGRCFCDGEDMMLLLANQIERMLGCFDVMLELASSSSSQAEGPRQFPVDRTVLRKFRGKQRMLPLRYSATNAVWTHSN